jgi:hypothetical protein
MKFSRMILLVSLILSATSRDIVRADQAIAGKIGIPASAATAKEKTAETEKLSLEIQKLKLEVASLKNQLGWTEELKAWISALATPLAALIGALWVYAKFVRAQERFPNIDFTADINVIGVQGEHYIVELLAFIENKGKAQHKMQQFKFDLNALYAGDVPSSDERWGGQPNFPHKVCSGSFMPKSFDFFFVDPGTRAKYSYLAIVPRVARFVILHCYFQYVGRNNYSHSAEKTIFLTPDGSYANPAPARVEADVTTHGDGKDNEA